MSFTRRNFLLGAGSGLGVLVLAACTDPSPTPQPTTSSTPVAGVPAPERSVRSNWSSDQFSRGSHSFATVGSSPDSRAALAAPLLGRVFFAGEATSVDNPSTVLGARASGARAAGEVLDAGAAREKVAVIGSGIAGAEAARILDVYGFDVVVIEARDRIGGRVHTATSQNWPLPVELGSWLLRETADASVIGRLVEAGLGATAITTTVYEGADVTENTVGPTTVTAAIDWASKQNGDLSLAEALDESGVAELSEGDELLLEQYLAQLSTITGADAGELSSWFGVPELPTLGEQQVAVTGGYSAFVTKSLEGIETFFATTVLGVNYDDEGVSLKLGTGESLGVDRVVVTVPLGVLKDGGIEFEPLLPFTTRAAISELGFGTVDTVWLKFNEPFWSTDATAWKLLGTDHAITNWINLEPIIGEPILVGFVGGDAAVTLGAMDDEAFLEAALTSLAPFLEA